MYSIGFYFLFVIGLLILLIWAVPGDAAVPVDQASAFLAAISR